MHHPVYPFDPDCPKCSGSGTVWVDCPPGDFQFAFCDCRKWENIKKVQDRCQHDFICKKCGKAGVPSRL